VTARNADRLGRLGVWTWLDMLPAPQAADFARQLEAWGYSALWFPEAVGRDPFSIISYLAGGTERLVFATGIANVYARDAMTMRAIQQTVGELSGGRFVLGLGVSHAPMVAGLRGHAYGKPVTTMRDYLDRMEKATYVGPSPAEETPVVIAALRPKMLALAAERCAGAHPYNSTPEHTARARTILGAGPTLAPEQMVLHETDPTKARTVARQNLAVYLGLPNYQNNWKWLGFEDADFADGGSDRLIDAVVAWGTEDAIRARIQAHFDAGADHVCIQAFRADGEPGPDLELLAALAPTPAPAARSEPKRPARKKKPAARKKKPAARKKKPTARKKKPAARKKKPTVRTKKSTSRKKKPVARKKKPAARKKPGARKKAKRPARKRRK
jgi:probable F420-dependent oxidoreductase